MSHKFQQWGGGGEVGGAGLHWQRQHPTPTGICLGTRRLSEGHLGSLLVWSTQSKPRGMPGTAGMGSAPPPAESGPADVPKADVPKLPPALSHAGKKGAHPSAPQCFTEPWAPSRGIPASKESCFSWSKRQESGSARRAGEEIPTGPGVEKRPSAWINSGFNGLSS